MADSTQPNDTHNLNDLIQIRMRACTGDNFHEAERYLIPVKATSD